MYNSLWFTYGTFIGEAITRDTKSEKAYALRFVIAIWLIYCLILSQSYAGSLKAFLTSPQRSEPIDTLEQVRNFKIFISSTVTARKVTITTLILLLLLFHGFWL